MVTDAFAEVIMGSNRILAIGVGLVVAAAVAIGLVVMSGSDLFWDDGDDFVAAGPGENAARALAGGPPSLLYISGTSLIRRDVLEQSDETIRELPAPDVFAAPGSRWIAYVEPKTEQTEDQDFVSEPELHVYDPESNDDTVIGAGVAPLWSPTGTRLAYLKPTQPRSCQGQSCAGDVAVAVADPESGESDELLDPARWVLLDWAGDRILVSDQDSPNRITSVSIDGEVTVLDIAPSELWDVSPDGRWLVRISTTKPARFLKLEDGRLAGRGPVIELGSFLLTDGSWAHDSSRVAAVVLQGRTSQIVTFSPEEPTLVPIEETFGAQGHVLWSVDGDALVFSTVIDPKVGLLQAYYCPVETEGACRTLMSWTGGVVLLRTE
jgi:hypothetical protein